MERNIRIAAPVAGGAAVISLLVGLVVGVPFGTALVRAMMSAAVFGALAMGVAIVARAQLPGFEHSPGGAATDASRLHDQSEPSEANAAGSRLNIVVEDDGQSADSEGMEGGDDFQGDSDSEPPQKTERADATTPPSDDAPATADRVPEVADEPIPSQDSSEDDDQAADLVEEVEESSAEDEEAVMHAAISEEQDGTSMEIDDTMLDEMPDIGKYSSSFVSGGDTESNGNEAPEGAGESGGFSGGAEQRKGDPRKGFDNKTVAKALQTLLEKDDE